MTKQNTISNKHSDKNLIKIIHAYFNDAKKTFSNQFFNSIIISISTFKGQSSIKAQNIPARNLKNSKNIEAVL